LQDNTVRQVGRSKQAAVRRNRHAGRVAGVGGRQTYRHTKAGWQRRRQSACRQKQAKKQSLASRQAG
jgi:hypothetical protein